MASTILVGSGCTYSQKNNSQFNKARMGVGGWGGGRRSAIDPNGKCPRVSNLLGLKKKIKIIILPHLPPSPTGKPAPSCPPSHTTKRSWTGERAEGLFRISHPFLLAPSVLNFQEKKTTPKQNIKRDALLMRQIQRSSC